MLKVICYTLYVYPVKQQLRCSCCAGFHGVNCQMLSISVSTFIFWLLSFIFYKKIDTWKLNDYKSFNFLTIELFQTKYRYGIEYKEQSKSELQHVRDDGYNFFIIDLFHDHFHINSSDSIEVIAS